MNRNSSRHRRAFGLILKTVSVLHASNQSMQHLAVFTRKWADLRGVSYWEEYVAEAYI